MKISSDRWWPWRCGEAGRTEELCFPAHFSHSLLSFRLACWRGWPVFLPGCSVEISGRIGVFTSPLSTLLILPTFQPEKAWSLPGGPLSWFMTGLLSFIYQTQRVEDGCLISFARYHWLWIIFLRSVQPSGGTEVSNHPAVCTVSQTTKCMYSLFNVCQEKSPFFTELWFSDLLHLKLKILCVCRFTILMGK